MDFAGQSSPYLLSGCGWGYGNLSGEDLVSSVVPPLFTFQGDGISGGCRTPRLVEEAVRVPALVNLWERQPSETAKAYAAFLLYRDLPAIDRSVAAAREGHQKDKKGTLRQWNGWSMRNGWVNRAAEHDSDLASRRRERMAQEIERSQEPG